MEKYRVKEIQPVTLDFNRLQNQRGGIVVRKGLALVFSLVLVFGALGALAEANSVSVMGVWGGQELEALEKIFDAFEAETGITVQFEGTRDLPTVLRTRLAAGNPPDVVGLSGPGMLKDYGDAGALVDLNEALDIDYLKENYNPMWLETASVGDNLYGMVFSADIKSIIWYNPKVWADRGYEIPQTWDEMEALMDQMVANGDTPWAIGLESGAASGWPGTDWIEDILLRTAGPEAYDQWVDHEIAWTDPAVKEAFEIFGSIARSPEYTYGAPTAVLATNFGDSPNALFTEPPRAMMHRQASFITSFIQENNPDVVIGEDVAFFPFPTINEEFGNPMMGVADMMAMMNDTEESRAFLNFLATPEAQGIWVSELGKLGVNQQLDPAVYPNDLTRDMARALEDADVFRFDGSDSMPSAVGSGAFWEGILQYVGGEDLDSVLEYIEVVSQETYEN